MELDAACVLLGEMDLVFFWKGLRGVLHWVCQVQGKVFEEGRAAEVLLVFVRLEEKGMAVDWSMEKEMWKVSSCHSEFEKEAPFQ